MINFVGGLRMTRCRGFFATRKIDVNIRLRARFYLSARTNDRLGRPAQVDQM